VGDGGGRRMRRDDWLEDEQWVSEADRMEYFGFDNEGLDIPSGFVMRH
jgi:hypothetical protein